MLFGVIYKYSEKSRVISFLIFLIDRFNLKARMPFRPVSNSNTCAES